MNKSTGYRSNRNKFIYNEFKPRVKNTLFEMLWTFDLRTGNSKNSSPGLLPNYNPVIIYSYDRKINAGKLFISGPLTHSITFASSSDCITLGASLKLFTFNIISNFPLLKFKNELINFSKAFGFSAENNILELMKKKTDIYSFEGILIKLLNQNKITNSIPDFNVSELVKIIIQSKGTVKLNDVYNKLEKGRRQLVRNFISATGLTPKQFNSISRIKALTRKLAVNHEKQADLMFEGGFFDQAHYCNEFKKLTGSYPVQFESNQNKIKYGNLITIVDNS